MSAKTPYLNIYIVTTDQWLERIDQGPLRGAIVNRLAGNADLLRLPAACIGVFYSSSGGGQSGPWFSVEGMLHNRETNGRVLNIIADTIMAIITGHCHSVGIESPISGHCTICSVEDSLHGLATMSHAEPAPAQP